MASAYLTRTPSSAGNRKTWTWSSWCKFSQNSNIDTLLSVGADSNNRTKIIRNNVQNGDIRFLYSVGGVQYDLATSALYRDVSAWYHIVVAVDTTQSTSSNRVKIYINGEQISAFDTENYLPQNTDTDINTTNAHYIGRYSYSASNYMDGSMAHVHFVDGIQYPASTFGQTDATTGIWTPKTAPSVTYGTNGFFLKFDNSGNIGLDSSGNSNNWTTNGTIIQNKDTPSNVFATGNILIPGTTLTQGNLTISAPSNYSRSAFSTLAVSKGKWYFEMKPSGSAGMMGVCDVTQVAFTEHIGVPSRGYGYNFNGQRYNNNTSYSWGNTFGSGDIIGCALDLDNNKIYFSKNGTWQESGDPTSGATGTGSAFDIASGYDYSLAFHAYSGSTTNANFGNGYFGTTFVTSAQNPDDGNGIFEYDVPAGYRALCTKSINAEEYS